MATLFSRIIEGELPGHFVYADPEVVGFLTIAPLNPGHTLVVPRAEVDQWIDAPAPLQAKLMEVAAIIGRGVKSAFAAPRAGLIIAGFEVPHLHLHVFPAWAEKDFSFANAKPAEQSDLAATAAKLRETLGTGQVQP